jgi:hypothetical protein
MLVNISGAMSKDRRPDSGLDEVGEKLHTNRLQRLAVVGIIEFHGFHDVAGKQPVLAIRFAAIEPMFGEDDQAARELLDKARAARGLAATEVTLFEHFEEEPKQAKASKRGKGDGPWPGDADYEKPKLPGEQPLFDDGTDPAASADGDTAATQTPPARPRRARKLNSVPDAG